MAIAIIIMMTKKTLKPVEEGLFCDEFFVEGSTFSAVVSVTVLLEVLTEATGGRLLVASGAAAGMSVDCSLDGRTTVDEFIDWGVVVAGACVSVEGTAVDVFILGGVGGVGLVGGVGDCISKPPL